MYQTIYGMTQESNWVALGTPIRVPKQPEFIAESLNQLLTTRLIAQFTDHDDIYQKPNVNKKQHRLSFEAR